MSQKVIICVDDEIIVLDALKEQLQQEFGDELIIEIAESGEEALEVYYELLEDGLDIPVIIADFIMPGMKGDDLLEKMHRLSPISKKIMLTGQASLDGVSNAVNRADLYRFISKPWDKEDLFLTIKEAIRSYNQSITIQKQNQELRVLNAGLEEKVNQRTKELQELNATKDKFFSIIAHDLKNPFNTLLGFSELLMENFELYTEKQVLDYIRIMFETSQNSYALLENLLNWSRSQTGSLKMDPQNVLIARTVSDVLGLLENQATKKNIFLESGVDLSYQVYADVNMIQTVLRNLVSNAIKFTKEGGSVSVIADEDEDGMLKLCVEDTGIGIKPESVDKLFKIDKNTSTKGTANETGTGIGLILCKEFVEKNKGKIWVESEVGKGSCFFFTVPLINADN